MTFGRTMFTRKYGIMEPHCHAEEIIYVLEAKKAHFRYGATEECLDGDVIMESDHVYHIGVGEWHVFEFDDEEDHERSMKETAEYFHLRVARAKKLEREALDHLRRYIIHDDERRPAPPKTETEKMLIGW